MYIYVCMYPSPALTALYGSQVPGAEHVRRKLGLLPRPSPLLTPGRQGDMRRAPRPRHLPLQLQVPALASLEQISQSRPWLEPFSVWKF